MTQTTTPKTDLEIFQSYQIDALQKRNEYLESKLLEAKELLNGIMEDASQIEVNNPQIV
jgi:hypothetical protein